MYKYLLKLFETNEKIIFYPTVAGLGHQRFIWLEDQFYTPDIIDSLKQGAIIPAHLWKEKEVMIELCLH